MINLKLQSKKTICIVFLQMTYYYIICKYYKSFLPDLSQTLPKDLPKHTRFYPETKLEKLIKKMYTQKKTTWNYVKKSIIKPNKHLKISIYKSTPQLPNHPRLKKSGFHVSSCNSLAVFSQSHLCFCTESQLANVYCFGSLYYLL